MNFKNELLNKRIHQRYTVTPVGHRQARNVSVAVYRAAAYLALLHSLSSHPGAQVIELEALFAD